MPAQHLLESMLKRLATFYKIVFISKFEEHVFKVLLILTTAVDWNVLSAGVNII